MSVLPSTSCDLPLPYWKRCKSRMNGTGGRIFVASKAEILENNFENRSEMVDATPTGIG